MKTLKDKVVEAEALKALELRIQKLEAKLFALLDPGQKPTEADFDWARAIIEAKQQKEIL